MKRAVLLAAFALAGCQTTGSTGPMSLGPDTYRINASRGLIAGGNTAAEKEALDEANRFCAQQNKQFVAIGTYEKGSAGIVLNANGGYQLDFRCLNSGDPGLVRPTPTHVVAAPEPSAAPAAAVPNYDYQPQPMQNILPPTTRCQSVPVGATVQTTCR
jgi:hypothetical protein